MAPQDTTAAERAGIKDAALEDDHDGAALAGSAEPSADAAATWKDGFRDKDRFLLGTVGFVLVFGAWELAATLGLTDPLFTSSPRGILYAAIEYIPSQEFLADLKVSGSELLLGLLLSLVVGIILGVLMGWYRTVYYLLDPFVSFLYSQPRIAFIPLTIIWFGIGISSKVALIFMMSVFPVLINTVAGVRAVDHELIQMARSFCASDAAIFRTVVLPSALSTVIAGIRLAVGLGLIAIAVGELFASKDGIGHLIAEAGSSFRTDRVFLGTFILGFFGVAFSMLLKKVEQRLEKWRPALTS